MARAAAALLARYNVRAQPPPGIERAVSHWMARISGAVGPKAEPLALFLVAREVCLAAQRDLAPVESPELAALQGVALVRDLAAADAGLRRALDAARSRIAELPPAARERVPSALRSMVELAAGPIPPLADLLARSFPTSFDRATVLVLRAAPRARLCTLRSADAPEGTLAAASPAGELILATPGEIRELPIAGPERTRRLARPLGPGRLVHAGGRLYHLAPGPTALEVTAVDLGSDEASARAVLEVRGPGFLPGGAAGDGGTILAFRRTASGVEVVRVDPGARRARRAGGFPAAPGHRDGPLGRARFLPGPATRLPRGALLFHDPAAGAVRILQRGRVGTIAGRVGRITSVAAAGGDRVFLAEEGRLAGALRRFHLRLLRLAGGACPR